jgi:hypothetical protein
MISRILLFFITILPTNSFAQTQSIPKVTTSQNKFTFYNEGKDLKISLGSGPLTNTFTYSVKVAKAGSTCYVVTEKDSLALFILPAQSVRFYVVAENRHDSLLCDFKGVVKAASFTNRYKKLNNKKIITEVPEVYELLNIIFALTKRGESDNNIAYKGSPYYQAVKNYFGSASDHPAVLAIDSLLKKGLDAELKMDSYAFILRGDKIINGGVYNRLSWGNENTLLTHIPLLESFAKKTRFRAFYKKHKGYYQQLIKDIAMRIRPAEMKQWLEKNFPSTKYASAKVVFSPLAGGNQSANWFEDNGFAEAQMHINAPHVGEWTKGLSENVINGQLSIPAFTELNHAYINPHAATYSLEPFDSLTKWTAGKFSSHYQDPFACFTEYVNWSLASLYFSDHYTNQDFKTLKEVLEKTMVNYRGFSKFKEFNEELLRLYKEREKGATVADLFSPLLAWAASQ